MFKCTGNMVLFHKGFIKSTVYFPVISQNRTNGQILQHVLKLLSSARWVLNCQISPVKERFQLWPLKQRFKLPRMTSSKFKKPRKTPVCVCVRVCSRMCFFCVKFLGSYDVISFISVLCMQCISMTAEKTFPLKEQLNKVIGMPLFPFHSSD